MRENESTLTEATAALGAVAARMNDEHVLHDAADADVLSVLASAGEAVRIAEAVLVAAVAEVVARSPKTTAKSERLTVRQGCASVNELVRRSTRASRRGAAAYERAANVTAMDRSPATGEILPARLPQLREALPTERPASTGSTPWPAR